MSIFNDPQISILTRKESLKMTNDNQTQSNDSSTTNSNTSSNNNGLIGSLMALSYGYRMWNKCSMMDVLLKMDNEETSLQSQSKSHAPQLVNLDENTENNNNDDDESSTTTSDTPTTSKKQPQIKSVIAAAIQNTATTSNSISNTKKNNFGLCRVCKDKATGIHYGIRTCEGCKGFFKRSLKKHEQYVCYFGNKCNMTPKLRKKCKLCRWKSCLEAGMSFGSMKMGRTSKRDLERAIMDDRLDEESMDADAMMAIPDPKLFSIERMCGRDKENLINFLTLRNLLNMCKTHPFKRDASQLVSSSFFSDAYMNTFNENILFVLSLLRDKCYQMFMELRRPFDPYYKRMLDVRRRNLHHQPPTDTDLVWALMQKTISEHVKSLVAYTRQLPGFNRLCAEDIALIVRNNTFSIFGMKSQYLFVDGENYLMLSENVQLSRHLLTRVLGETLAKRIFEYHMRLGELGLTDYELAVICPFLLSMPGPSLIDADLLGEIHEYYKRVLLYELSIGNRDERFLETLNEVLGYIPENERLCIQTNYTGHRSTSRA